MSAIRNPIELGVDAVKQTGGALQSAGAAVRGRESDAAPAPTVNRIALSDLRAALAKGIEDFSAARTDIVFLCVIYPIAGLLLGHAAFRYDMLPLIFPAASGFALLGPVAAIGLYELSRQREAGQRPSWSHAFGMVASPSFGAILLLGLALLALFLAWMGAAQAIYAATLGPAPPASLPAFVGDVFTTAAGWTMILVGCGVGFLFAALALTISAVSFPLLLDRPVGVVRAVVASARVVWRNPVPMAAWGLFVAASLVAGSIPLFLGLIIVMPVLGHATWHLYRRAVAR